MTPPGVNKFIIVTPPGLLGKSTSLLLCHPLDCLVSQQVYYCDTPWIALVSQQVYYCDTPWIACLVSQQVYYCDTPWIAW